jgi:NADPH:quinone reductase-like Zn-dependent oxidoreductase
VHVRAASLNRGEFIRGHGLTKPGAAKAAGTDGAGEVVGSGKRVMGRLPGAFGEYALMDEPDAIAVPEQLSWEEAAAVPITFLVVYDMLVQQGRLQPNEWLLITGVSAGVGVAALLAAKAIGARVIGTSGSGAKLEALKRHGLDVDGVLQSEIDLEALHSKRLKLFGVSNKLRTAAQRALTVQGFTRDWLPLFASGKLKPLVDRVYDFAELPQAVERMEADAHVGKIVVRV